MNHDVRNRDLRQLQETAEHVALVTFDFAVAMQDVDRAPEFLVAGNAGVPLAERDAAQAQDAAHQDLDRAHDRTENGHEEGNQRRNEQRNAIRMGDSDRLRHHLAENDNQRGHDCRRGPHPALAEGLKQDARGDRRGADGDELPSEQHCADEASARADETRDQLRPFVARRFERMHAGARGCREGGLGPGEERRGGDAQDDDDNVEGVRHQMVLTRAVHSGVMRFEGRVSSKEPVRAPGMSRRSFRQRRERRNSRRCL